MIGPHASPSELACAAAIRQGALIRDRSHWRFGRRLFNNATVNKLIAAGAAVRKGKKIVRTETQ